MTTGGVEAGGRLSSTWGPTAVPGRQRDERRMEMTSGVTNQGQNRASESTRAAWKAGERGLGLIGPEMGSLASSGAREGQASKGRRVWLVTEPGGWSGRKKHQGWLCPAPGLWELPGPLPRAGLSNRNRMLTTYGISNCLMAH